MRIRKCPSLIFHANGYLTLNQQKGCPIFFYQSLWQLACLLPSSTYLLTNCPSCHWVHGQQQFHSILFFCGPTSGLSPTSGVWLLFPPCPVCCQVLGQPLFLFLSGVQWGSQSFIKLGKGQTLSTGHVVTKMVVTWSAALTRRWLTGPAMTFSDLVLVESESLFYVMNNFFYV